MGEGAPDLIVAGDVMVDVSVDAGALAHGGDVHGDVRIRPGGGGANAAVWAAAEGAEVRLYGRVGDDLMGRLVAEALAARGVDARLAVDRRARTGAMLVIRSGTERSMIADRGANAGLLPVDLPDRLRAGAVLVSGYLVFDPGSEPAARAALQRADAPIVAVDAASWPLVETYGAERFLRTTSRANVLLANEREVEALGGVSLGAPLRSRYERVCVKRGAHGAFLAEGDHTELIVPQRVTDAVDTTGAGDAFDGALLAALARGLDAPQAIRRGCAAGYRVAASEETWP